MKELSPAAKALIQSGKAGVDPSDVDRERVLAGLQARITAGEGAAEPDSVGPGATTPPIATPKPWGLISAGSVGVGLIAGALAWSLAPEGPTVAPPPEAQIVATPGALAPPPLAEETKGPATRPEREAPRTNPAPVRAEPARAEPPASEQARGGSLAEEVALLSRATAALHAGRGDEALRAVAEHQQKFPSGVLIEERRSARAQALCLLGRPAEAKRELDRLSPTSPQAARARERCGL